MPVLKKREGYGQCYISLLFFSLPIYFWATFYPWEKDLLRAKQGFQTYSNRVFLHWTCTIEKDAVCMGNNRNYTPFNKNNLTETYASLNLSLATYNRQALSSNKDVILTSVFNYLKDPQRGRYVSPTLEYMYNFYTSVNFHKLRAVVFHNNLSESLVKSLTTPLITFVKVKPNKSYSTNDFRFLVYKDFLVNNTYDYVFMADTRDVFFHKNPFNLIRTHAPKQTLFFSSDDGSIGKGAKGRTGRHVKVCFKRRLENDTQYAAYNAGLWGGTLQSVQCMLNCMATQFTSRVKGRGNCNMPVFNMCAHVLGNCSRGLEKTVPNLFNPWIRNCDSKYAAVHNKCPGREGKVCLKVDKQAVLLCTKTKQFPFCSRGDKNLDNRKCAEPKPV